MIEELKANELSTEFSAGDRLEIGTLVRLQDDLCFEYTRQAEELEIDPRPVPHEYLPHKEKATLARLAFLLATVGGAAIAVLLTLGVLSKLLVALLVGFGSFAVSEWLLKVQIAAYWNLKYFVRNFGTLFLLPLTLFVLSSSVVLMGRVANADTAEFLMLLAPYAWWLMELSLLVLGAFSYVAWKRFSWSTEMYGRYQRLGARVEELKLRLGRRGQQMLMIFIAAVLVGSVVRPLSAQCLLVGLDRTGSVAEQVSVEHRLVDALVFHADQLACISLVLFSDHALQSQIITVQQDALRGELGLMNRAAKLDLWRRQLRKALLSVLSVVTPPARCTSLADMTLLVSGGPAFLVTDGVHDCATPRTAGPWSGGDNVTVVLLRSKLDVGNDVDLFRPRVERIREYLPKARVVPGALLEESLTNQLGALSLASGVQVSKVPSGY